MSSSRVSGRLLKSRSRCYEIASPGSVLDGEADFLQSHATMVVAAEDVDAGFLERAEKAPLPGGLIILTLAVVGAIPNRGATEKRLRANEYREVIGSDRLVSSFQFRLVAVI
jgi:hypothetical protein